MRVIEFTVCKGPVLLRLTCHMGEAYRQPAEAHRNGRVVRLCINQQVS